MELIQTKKAWVIVNCAMQASGVQVLEWGHLKNALMEHIAMQSVLDIVFCVQKVIGEGFVPYLLKYQVMAGWHKIRFCPYITNFKKKFNIVICDWC